MVDNNNVFYSKTHEELILLFEQFLESEKTGSIPDNELGKIRDEYCERYRPNGILMLITDLTRVLAELWYEDNRWISIFIGRYIMITGDRKLGFQYRDLIIEQLKKEINPSKERLQKMIDRLNNASSDELERVYEAFDRFGVQAILDAVCE